MIDPLIPWSVARLGIFVPYDYVEDEPMDFTFISSIPTDELKELEIYCRLQIQYDTPKPKHELLDWGDLLRLILIEKDYRENLKNDY